MNKINFMTRDEEIREASIDYQISTNPRAIGGDAFADFAREMNVNPGFVAGANWSDNNPSQKALAKELYRLGYTMTLNGDIISRAEEEKATKSYIEYRISRVIENACEWLEDMACYYAHWEYNGDTYEREVVLDEEELIKDFKKAMEGGEE